MLADIWTESDQSEETDWINHQLFQVLSLNLEGKALNMVRNLNTNEQKYVDGVIAWCKLIQECTSMTSQRLQGLAQKVYSPKKSKTYADVNANIKEWENCI